VEIDGRISSEKLGGGDLLSCTIKTNGIAMLIAAIVGGAFMIWLPYALMPPTHTIKDGFTTELGIAIISISALILIIIGLLSRR
jgi:hypothetical protein